MLYDFAVDECKRVFADGAPAWPVGLIRFLDQPPDGQRVFTWVIRCTRRLLVLLGESTPNLEEQLTLLDSYVNKLVDVAVIRETVESLWVQRSPHETAKTAVVQLFAALVRYRQNDIYRHLTCTVSITMLVDAAANREEAVKVVLQDFVSFVSKGNAEPGAAADRPRE